MRQVVMVLGLLALAPVVGAQDERTEGTRGPGPAANMARFGAGIALSEAGLAALDGNTEGVGDAAAMVTSPEFYASLATFELSRAGGDALARRIGGNGRLVGALKNNLVMAGAMTAVSAIEFDLGGFTPGDALRGDFSELRNARVGLRDVDAQDIGITLAAFSVAQPVWNRVRNVGGRFARILGRRFLRTAAVKGALAVAPVPGSRVVAGLITAGDVVLSVVEVAGLLTTARVIEEPVREWNDERRASAAMRRDRERLEAAVRSGDSDELDAAIAAAQGSFDGSRSLRDLPFILDTLAFQRRLDRLGIPRAETDALAAQTLDDYGQRLALPGHSANLVATFQDRVAAGDVPGDPEDFRRHLENHRERLVEHLEDDEQAERRALYRQEEALFRRLAERASSPAAREALLAAAEEAAANAYVDEALRDQLRTPTPRPGSAPPGPVETDGFTDVLEDSTEAAAGGGDDW